MSLIHTLILRCLMIRIVIVFMLFFASIAHGEIKEFVKEGVVPVPANQSFDQVVEYTSKRMAREATEEAGIFISSLSSVKNGRLSKDEVATVAGSIAKITVDRREPVVKNGASYASVRVKVLIDTDTVASYLKKIVENEEYKKEAEALRKKNLELENRLKNANKEEFDKELSTEAEILASEQKKRYLEIKGLEEKAKAEYLEAERRRMDEEIKTREQLAELKRQFAEEEAQAKKRISAAQTEIAKAELENSAKIAALERNAQENKASWLILSEITAEEAEGEATKIRAEITYLKTEFKAKLNDNAKRLETVYDNEITSVESRQFTEPAPVKGEWTKTDDYNSLKADYDKRKRDFEISKNNTVRELRAKKEQALKDVHLSGEKAMKDSLKPLTNRLKEHNAGRYVSIKEEYAAISFGAKDVDNDKLNFTLNYAGKNYNFAYVFDSTADFRAMYETRSMFYAVPTFGIEPYKTRAKKFLSGFTVTHLGNNKKAWFKVADGEPFPEVQEQEGTPQTIIKVNRSEQTTTKQQAPQQRTEDSFDITERDRAGLGIAVHFPLNPSKQEKGATKNKKDHKNKKDIAYANFYYQFPLLKFTYLDFFMTAGLITKSVTDSSENNTQKSYKSNDDDDDYYYPNSNSGDSEEEEGDVGGIATIGAVLYPVDWFYLSAEVGGYSFLSGYSSPVVKGSAGFRLGNFAIGAVYQPAMGDQKHKKSVPETFGLVMSIFY